MLLNQLQQDLKQAQLDRNETRVSTLRLLISEIKNAEISKGGALSDADTLSIVQKETKKRKEAATAFRGGNREESAQKEEAELKVLESYLPKQLTTEELTKVVEETINEVGATSIADMGRVIGAVMGKIKGQADGGTVSNLVKEKFGQPG